MSRKPEQRIAQPYLYYCFLRLYEPSPVAPVAPKLISRGCPPILAIESTLEIAAE